MASITTFGNRMWDQTMTAGDTWDVYYTNTTSAGTSTSMAPTVGEQIHWSKLTTPEGYELVLRKDRRRPLKPTPEPPRGRTAPQNFNKYINASDLLKEFIGFLGEQEVRRGQVMGLPLEYFVKWLIVRACEEDGEEPNVEIPALPAPKNRCLGCGQFMSASQVALLALHGAKCAERYFQRQVQLS